MADEVVHNLGGVPQLGYIDPAEEAGLGHIHLDSGHRTQNAAGVPAAAIVVGLIAGHEAGVPEGCDGRQLGGGVGGPQYVDGAAVVYVHKRITGHDVTHPQPGQAHALGDGAYRNGPLPHSGQAGGGDKLHIVEDHILKGLIHH